MAGAPVKSDAFAQRLSRIQSGTTHTAATDAAEPPRRRRRGLGLGNLSGILKAVMLGSVLSVITSRFGPASSALKAAEIEVPAEVPMLLPASVTEVLPVTLPETVALRGGPLLADIALAALLLLVLLRITGTRGLLPKLAGIGVIAYLFAPLLGVDNLPTVQEIWVNYGLGSFEKGIALLNEHVVPLIQSG